MAATPPMPPGANHLQLNGHNTQQQQQQQQQPARGNNNSRIADLLQHHIHFKELLHADEQQQQQSENNHSEQSNAPVEEAAGAGAAAGDAPGRSKSSCQCSNISIMHLFHEMKQEFPTLPDALVTQCVNENCHQRENCIQMLRKELVLQPLPVQSYPAKVLQQQHQQQHRQAKPPTPLKPSRAAPTLPPPPQGVSGDAPATPTPPRPQRPTTLNLQRQFNAQLQQKIQQRQQQQQQNAKPPPQLTPTAQYKPLRRAPPLPPLPPKPHTAAVSFSQQPQPLASSFSNDSSCLTSPLSSSESEISLNVSLSSPTTAPAATATASSAAAASAQLRSPVRHRSVITLQPEPPYAREFLNNIATSISPTPPSPTSGASTPSGSGSGTRKSFTSLNLTLRQPALASNGNPAPAPSTIDITAGPAASGNGSSGITYSSSSFDARRGTQKNFQLTVTDEGSVFSAGCVRPQLPMGAPCQPPTVLTADGSTPPPAYVVTSQQQQQREREREERVSEMPEVFPYPTQTQNHIVPSNYNNNLLSNTSDNSPSVTHMPLYEGVVPECDREARAATIARQRARRDKLANALRENRKRYESLEREVDILTSPIPAGEFERRLDQDIAQLREACNRLLDCQLQQPGPAAADPPTNAMNRQYSEPAGNRLTPPASHRNNHWSTGSRSPVAPTRHQQHNSWSAPSSACVPPSVPHPYDYPPPPPYGQVCPYPQFRQDPRIEAPAAAAGAQSTPTNTQRNANDDEDSDSVSESDVDEGEQPLDKWPCIMCTFLNHPQLNVCETCENVRIQPAPRVNREDIHITLSPGENRIIHSWILS